MIDMIDFEVYPLFDLIYNVVDYVELAGYEIFKEVAMGSGFGGETRQALFGFSIEYRPKTAESGFVGQ
jgi:hypothetical protein